MEQFKMVDDIGLSYDKIKEILQGSEEFLEHKSEIESINAEMISEGKGFLSRVFRVNVNFTNSEQFSFILKIPVHAGLQQIIENEKPNGKEDVIDQIVVDGHNTEVDFYQNVHNLHGFVCPKVYSSEKIMGKQGGMLAMQDLTKFAEPLGFYRSANVNQVLNVARALADLQFCAERKDFAHWWKSSLRVTIHLEEIYTKYTEGSVRIIENIPEIYQLLPKIAIVFNQAFGYYCLLDRPKQYEAMAFCHGDTQPNNMMFKLDEKGELTDELSALIDWQLIFCGNPLFDLARFLTFGVNAQTRKEIETEAFNVYYQRLTQLYENNQEKMPFEYVQGFELLELALCQQVGFIVTFIGIFFMSYKQSGREIPPNFQIIVDRAKYSIERGIEIIGKYQLDKIRFNLQNNHIE